MSGFYDNPIHACYNFGVMDFGAAAGVTTHQVAGPAGKQGRLKGIAVATTEATVFATTLGKVQVGKIGDLDAYGELNIPTAIAINTVVNSTDDPDAIIAADIPAETAVQVTLVEGTGAGLTGQGQVFVYIDWF